MRLKRYINFILVFVVCFSFLTACGGNKVKSATEAKRVLLTAVTDISELRSVMNEWETSSFKQSDLDNVSKKLNNYLNDIHSTDSYKDVDTVKEQYDKALDIYERALLEIEKYEKILEVREKDLYE